MDPGPAGLLGEGHGQGRLGHSVAGREGRLGEAVGSVAILEGLERAWADHFGADPGQAPVAEVEALELALLDAIDAPLVAEVGGAVDDLGVLLGDRAQPLQVAEA